MVAPLEAKYLVIASAAKRDRSVKSKQRVSADRWASSTSPMETKRQIAVERTGSTPSACSGMELFDVDARVLCSQ